MKREEVIKVARKKYADCSDDQIEIDDDAKVSRNDEDRSCWVQAWVWLHDEDFD